MIKNHKFKDMCIRNEGDLERALNFLEMVISRMLQEKATVTLAAEIKDIKTEGGEDDIWRMWKQKLERI